MAPQIAPRLPCDTPTFVHAGAPTDGFPHPWAVYRWVDGDDASATTTTDPARFGRALAHIVKALGEAPVGHALADPDLGGDRGGEPRDRHLEVEAALTACRSLPLDEPLDVDRLQAVWRAGIDTRATSPRRTWLHADLRPGNIVIREGMPAGVIDFGCLTVGLPDAEHAVMWDYPSAARDAYRAVLAVDEASWRRAAAWAVGIAAPGAPYYARSHPDFAAECVARLRAVLSDTAVGHPPSSR